MLTQKIIRKFPLKIRNLKEHFRLTRKSKKNQLKLENNKYCIKIWDTV